MMKPTDVDALLAQSMEELRLKTRVHDGAWHLGKADWSVDQDRGQIVFDHNGITAIAPVQIVGTFNIEDSTWLWGWDHPSVDRRSKSMPSASTHMAKNTGYRG